MSWLTAMIHVLDFEGSRRTGVIEYGVATLRDGVVVGVQTRLCAAAASLTMAETAVHGLREADTVGALPFAADHALFAELRQSGPLAAHHAPVERGLLRRVWPVPQAVPDFSAPQLEEAPRVSDWGPWLDTRRLYERLYPGQSGYQLMELVRAFSLEDELAALVMRHCPVTRRRPHCALFDALGAALLIARLAREPALNEVSLASLLSESSPAAEDDARRQGDLWE